MAMLFGQELVSQAHGIIGQPQRWEHSVGLEIHEGTLLERMLNRNLQVRNAFAILIPRHLRSHLFNATGHACIH
jgi:hypothetical protein